MSTWRPDSIQPEIHQNQLSEFCCFDYALHIGSVHIDLNVAPKETTVTVYPLIEDLVVAIIRAIIRHVCTRAQLCLSETDIDSGTCDPALLVPSRLQLNASI
eukprot:356149_1